MPENYYFRHEKKRIGIRIGASKPGFVSFFKWKVYCIDEMSFSNINIKS